MVILSKNFTKTVFRVSMLPISKIFKLAVGFTIESSLYISRGLNNNIFKLAVGFTPESSLYITRGLNSNNFKLLMSFLTAVILASSIFATNSWAYKPGTFPGVGSYAKWQEGVAIFEQAYSTKNTPEAIKLYQKAIDTYPYDATFWFALGNLYTDKHKKIECFLKAAELNPDDCGGYQNAGYECQQLGNYKQAIEFDKKAIAINPLELKCYGNLADVYEKLGRREEVIATFNLGFNNTHNALFLYAVGVEYEKLNEYKKALANFEIYLRQYPNDKKCLAEIKKVQSKLH